MKVSFKLHESLILFTKSNKRKSLKLELQVATRIEYIIGYKGQEEIRDL